jgi:nucleolar protein 12
MDPYEAAEEAVKKADGSLFHERLIRVDFVRKARDTLRGVDQEGDGVKRERAFQDANPKMTIFVGNLDLGSQEDDLRAFFESLMKTERGEPPVHEDKDQSGETKKPRTWVTQVRIIRDKDTQVGKGFGYVQFAVSPQFHFSLAGIYF